MILDRETIPAEQMLAKLAHKSTLFFAVSKTALSREINLMFEKARHDC